jgi:copper(I)-binding protein
LGGLLGEREREIEMTKQAIRAAAVGLGALAISACSSGADEAVVDETPDGVAGLEISDASMRLPPVEGNPAAIYFTASLTGEDNISIRKADVEGAANAQIHETVDVDGKATMGESLPVLVKAGESVVFEPGGRHIMAFDLAPDMNVGGTTEVTLTIAGGDKHSFEVPIMAAGADR